MSNTIETIREKFNAIDTLTNTKMESILEKFIIYLKDNALLEASDYDEFHYDYVEYILLFIGDRDCYKDAYTYLKELINCEFERTIIDECYEDNIIWILKDIRGVDDDDYYEDDENIQEFIDSEGETDEEIWIANENYKFERNMLQYIEYLLETNKKVINKVEFIKSI